MKSQCKYLAKGAAVAALILAAGSLNAFARTIALAHDQIVSIDRVNMTLTVKPKGSDRPLTLYINSQTRLFKNGEPTLSSELEVGDNIRGLARQDAQGRLEAVQVYDRDY